MTKRDILELRKRFTKDCTLTRLAGCYVDCNKHKVLTMNENFLNLQEDELYKYLEIAKKTLGGAVGDNLLELDFPSQEEEAGGKQQFLRGLVESKLENDALLDRLYDLIIDKYDYTGNYLILVYRDSYDIMTRTKDNIKLDESEEVYEYILVSVCPVDLSKPGLGYRTEENRIGVRVRDWVVGAPETGFLFPAFSDRSADINKVAYFTRDPQESHPEFVEDVLGCSAKRTSVQKRQTFNSIVTRAFNNDEEKASEAIMEIQENLNGRLEEDEEEKDELKAPIIIDDSLMAEVLQESGVNEERAELIRKDYAEEFAGELPAADQMVDARAIKANAPVKREKELVKEVFELKEKLRQQKSGALSEEEAARYADMGPDEWNALGDGSSDSEDGAADGQNFDVVLRVAPDKVQDIREEIIDNRKYILIPLDGDEQVSVNGEQL